MFEKLMTQPADNIMALMGIFASDKRENKIDLGVGVYKDRTGNTPIMGAVKAAEQQLLDSQASKSYVGLLGSLGFVDQIIGLTHLAKLLKNPGLLEHKHQAVRVLYINFSY